MITEKAGNGGMVDCESEDCQEQPKSAALFRVFRLVFRLLLGNPWTTKSPTCAEHKSKEPMMSFVSG